MSNNFIKSNQFSTIVSNPNKSLLYYRAKNLPPKRKNKKFSYQDQSFKTKFEGIILKKDYYIQNLFYRKSQESPLTTRNRNNCCYKYYPKQVILRIENQQLNLPNIPKSMYSKYSINNKLINSSSRIKTEPSLFHNSFLKNSIKHSELSSSGLVDGWTDMEKDNEPRPVIIKSNKKVYFQQNICK